MPKNRNHEYFQFYYNFNKIDQEKIERNEQPRIIYCKIAIDLNFAFYFMN